MKYVCDLCGWIYDTEVGDPKRKIPAGTMPEDIPKYSGCPVCGADWDSFTKLDSQKSAPAVGKQEHSTWSAMKYQDKHQSDR